MPFPEHYEDFLRPVPQHSPEARTAELLKIFRDRGQVTLTPEAVLACAREGLLSGRTGIYGTGAMADIVAHEINQREDAVCPCFFDRQASEMQSRGGIPVLDPAAAADQSLDQILVFARHAADEMTCTLRSLGVPDSRIVTLESLLSSEAIQGRVLAGFRDGLAELGECRSVIITSLPKTWSVVQESVLEGLFPPEGTALIGFSAKDPGLHSFEGTPYRRLDCQENLVLLEEALERLKPDNVYLRVSPHVRSEFLVCHIRDLLPGCFLIVEQYDVGPFFPRQFLFTADNFTEEIFEASHLAHYSMAKQADVIVAKQGGPAWDRLAASFHGDVFTYFPQVPVEAAALPELRRNPLPDAPRRLLAASSMQASELLSGAEAFAGDKMFGAFLSLTESRDLTIDLYNAAHTTAEQDDEHSFRLLIEVFGQPGSAIRYHRGVPLPILLERMADYHLGFACVHLKGSIPRPSSLVSISNRLSTYVLAGLPSVVDSEMVFAASLIGGFGAGLVVEPEDVGDPRAILDLDLDKATKGVAALRRHMVAVNAAFIAEVGRLMGRGRPMRNGQRGVGPGKGECRA